MNAPASDYTLKVSSKGLTESANRWYTIFKDETMTTQKEETMTTQMLDLFGTPAYIFGKAHVPCLRSMRFGESGSGLA